MKHSTWRLFLVLVLSMLFAASSSTRSVAAHAAPSIPPQQQFVGLGRGTQHQPPGHGPIFSGSYTMTGQLGRGAFSFDWPYPNGWSPTHARFSRSDGMTLVGTANYICYGNIPTGTMCTTVHLTGSDDIAEANFEVRTRGPRFRQYSSFSGTITLNHRIGYAMVAANGTAYTFGGIEHHGNSPSPSTDLALTPSNDGYWMVNARGQVFTFGDAAYFGNAAELAFATGEVVTSMSATPTGRGYWLFTSRGRVFTFGDARSYGDLHATPLRGRIIGSVATSTGRGYYMVGTDGGVFAFGDAEFRGSTGNRQLNGPVVGLVPTRDNRGYWLVASDGGVFSFGAPFLGSMGATRLNKPIVSMVPYGGAYLMIASDGGVFSFSHAPFFGSIGAGHIPTPIVAGAASG